MQNFIAVRASLVLLSSALGIFLASSARAQAASQAKAGCTVEAVDYHGWSAQLVSNRWVRLVIVPQNGGRLMQVSFAGHDYLFVNPEYLGKYFPPTSAKWFNYGGDKLWLLPEGNDDEQHWPGNSDILDDGPYTFRKLSEGQRCEIELVSPADPQTGVQISRTISVGNDSPRIEFHASLKNISGHTVDWSMQSVSQYYTGAPGNPSHINPNFWAFTPSNPASRYLNHYHVRFGPAENPAVSIRDDGMFTVHYAHMAAELWLDTVEGWLATVDGGSQFAMVERFEYEHGKEYPGWASMIFWTNGPELHMDSNREAAFGTMKDSPYYMEAEIDSPMCHLRPGEACHLDTEWFPTRAEGEIHGVAEAGILVKPLQGVQQEDGKVRLTGTFGVFYAGHLVAHFYDQRGSSLGTAPVATVAPSELVELQTDIEPKGKAARVSLHLEDEAGADRGALQEVWIGAGGGR